MAKVPQLSPKLGENVSHAHLYFTARSGNKQPQEPSADATLKLGDLLHTRGGPRALETDRRMEATASASIPSSTCVSKTHGQFGGGNQD